MTSEQEYLNGITYNMEKAWAEKCRRHAMTPEQRKREKRAQKDANAFGNFCFVVIAVVSLIAILSASGIPLWMALLAAVGVFVVIFLAAAIIPVLIFVGILYLIVKIILIAIAVIL